MLRVGLTGGLGSGKSTVGRIFRGLGASVISADEVGRRLMQPGEEVYAAIVRQFGSGVVLSDGSLDRKALAKLAFQQDQLAALNRIVHPATVKVERQWMAAIGEQNPSAIAIVESALIFEVERWGTAPGWMEDFDRLVLVTAPDEMKIARVVSRAMNARGEDPAQRALFERDARARLARQIPDIEKMTRCDFVIDNAGPLEETRKQAEAVYTQLKAETERRSRFRTRLWDDQASGGERPGNPGSGKDNG